MTTIRVTLRSDDPPAMRVEKIMLLLSFDGDPRVIQQTAAVIRDALEQYAEIDAEVRG